jgi:fatty acid desaturase
VLKRTDGVRPGHYDARQRNEVDMLTTIAVVLLVLWLAGVVTSTSMGGLIHVLLVIAVVMVLVRVIQGRRVFD